MEDTKLKQLAMSFLIVLSFFVSSVAACCCSHQQEKAEIEAPSCHTQTHEAKTEKHQASNSAETEQVGELNIPCECFVQHAPKVFAKSENVKIEKQSLTIAASALPKEVFVLSVISFESNFAAPFYLSDSFYNLSPGRAPPRL